MKYALMLRPNNNIPYFEEMKKLCIHEINLMFSRLKLDLLSLEVTKLGRATYLIVELENLLEDKFFKHISRLSFYYSLFEIQGEVFKPIDIQEKLAFDEDLSVRLKYNGKTNESFTRLLINSALYTSNYFNVDKTFVYDPMCGKGTTLFEGLIQGYQVYGAELNKKAIDEMWVYFSRYLKEGKYKHEMMNGKAQFNGKTLGEIFEAKAARTKDTFKNNSSSIKIFRGDTTKSNLIFKKNSMHIIVTDLPYGVAHMGKSEEESSRNLYKLLNHSFIAWYELLKKGGALALSWNTYTNKREDIVKLLEDNNYKVMNSKEYTNFKHRVSQAINRDIIVALKI